MCQLICTDTKWILHHVTVDNRKKEIQKTPTHPSPTNLTYRYTKEKWILNRIATRGKSDKYLYGDQHLDFFNLFILWLFMCAALRPKPKQKQYWSFLGILWRRNDKQYTPKRLGSQIYLRIHMKRTSRPLYFVPVWTASSAWLQPLWPPAVETAST